MLATLLTLILATQQTAPADSNTLAGKVMVGYQGWFFAPGDGYSDHWIHWGPGEFRPGKTTVEMWPDMAEADEDEKYPTPFKHKDGSTAHVFSSAHPKTVARHFQWLKDYGIDGAFLQRFGSDLRSPEGLRRRDRVLQNVRTGASAHGRTWAMMYDLSGLQKGQIESVIKHDWKHLNDNLKIRQDKTYLHHNGKPVVAVWGIGFNDNRAYTLQECQDLVDFLKNDPVYGGNTVMVGVPTGWREQVADSVQDPKLQDIIDQADIVSPWTVGRFNSLDGVQTHADRYWAPDFEWCQSNDKFYLPVTFPGFSWFNLMQVRGREAPFNAIPRQEGKFLWAQYAALTKIGVPSVYQAMFDEVDEATAIFKTTQSPPTGDSPFLSEPNLPPDHYLWLVGEGRKMTRRETPFQSQLPARNKKEK